MNKIFKKAGFLPTDILLPKEYFEKWSVIACDQYTSDVEYWRELYSYVADNPSTLHMILPEYLLGRADITSKISAADDKMEEYLASDVLCCYPGSFVFVEREQSTGGFREGIVGMLDLEKYDFTPGSNAAIRATEKTVLERIPPRVKIRENAALELPHILILCDDRNDGFFGAIRNIKDKLPKLYDFKLCMNGQRIIGSRISGEMLNVAAKGLETLLDGEAPFIFAAGDGNHSLATAKTCYERMKQTQCSDEALEKARYALVEVVSLYDKAMPFEPIHRLVFESPEVIKKAAAERQGEEAYSFGFITSEGKEELTLHDSHGKLPTAVMEEFLDGNSFKVDYIHGESDLTRLATEQNAVGILLPPIDRGMLFGVVDRDGVLPKKTFSLGEAQDKRYYLECRRIR